LTERYADYANERKTALDAALSVLGERYKDSIKEYLDERSEG
jgi:hypothetical protein